MFSLLGQTRRGFALFSTRRMNIHKTGLWTTLMLDRVVHGIVGETESVGMDAAGELNIAEYNPNS